MQGSKLAIENARGSKPHRPRLGDEGGQSLIVVVAAMFLIIAMCALAIDVATWYQKHHQAQVAADAAALAAANCIANAGSGSSTCTSTGDTAHATAVATNLSQTNGVTISASNVSYDSTTNPSTVTVTTPNPAPAFFAGLFGIGGSVQTATAAATWKVTGTNCKTLNNTCDFIFANDKTCPGGGITIQTNGTASSITGAIQSNSDISGSATGNSNWNVNSSYSNGLTCSGPSASSATPPFSAAATKYTVPATWPNDWPINWAVYYPACSTTGAVKCNSSGTPSYCTQSGSSFSGSQVSANGIYCAYGSGTPSNPATWNGSITVYNSISASFIGGDITISAGTQNIQPYPGTSLLAYATGTGTAINASSSGNGSISGDLFAPNGTVNVSIGGSQTFTGFIEGYDVSYSSHGNDQGDGPNVPASGGPPINVSDALVN